jgi:hypothetical protein
MQTMDVRTPQPDDLLDPAAESGERAPVKFLYPTGSQPLEGYTIKRGVGRGGFGEVYFATSDAGKEVALKLIRRNLDVELRGVKHCLNLKHVNLIAIYDIRTDSMGDQWVVMEYVSGESLEEAIERHPTGMPKDEVLKWMQGIGAGVAYLHDHGIVHRDLKPGNVFLDYDSSEGGTVKIGDYGLSKFISCSRRSGQTESVGTVHYMAPEIANGRYGREIDTYALGVMLYEMLTGHVPFEGESVGEVLMKHLTAEPDLSKLDASYREIVQRTLAKDPLVRIGSVGELLDLLPDGKSVGPLRPKQPEGWTARHAAADGIGASLQFPDTSVRGKVPPMPPLPPHVKPADEVVREPIHDYLANMWSSWIERWDAWPAHPVAKALVLMVIVAALVTSLPRWGATGVLVLAVYGLYYAFWAVAIRPTQIKRRQRESVARQNFVDLPPSDLAQPPADAPPMSRAERRRNAAMKARYLRADWKQRVHAELRAKSFREQLSELIKSMVMAGIACTFLSLLAVVVVGGSSPNERIPLHLWFTAVSTFMTWVVLITGKLTEGRYEDQMPIRVWQGVGGALVGLVAWWLSSTMMIGVPKFRDAGIEANDSLIAELMNKGDSDFMANYGNYLVMPDWVCSVLYFSLLMLVLRWWRQTEFARRHRLSIVSVGIAVSVAWLAHLVCWYPQPTGMVVAGIVAIAAQFVSPWLPPSGRKVAVESARAV